MSPRHTRKLELIGRLLPARQALLRKASWPDRLSSESPLHKTGEAFLKYNGFPASEAGPSGVCHDSPFLASPHTIDLDKSMSVRYSLGPVTQDLPPPHSSPIPLLPDVDAGHQYGLSTQRRSHQITEHVEKVSRVRWGTNHVQFIEREEEEEEEEEEASITEENSNMEDEEDRIGHDDELEDEDMPFAEPGQEGVSVWDLLGRGFWKEVTELGQLLLNQF